MPERIRDTWLLRRREIFELVAIYIAFTAIWVLVGWLLTDGFENSWIQRADQSIAEWLAARRTPRLDSLSSVGAMLSDTLVKIVVTAVVAAAMLLIWRRWLEPLMVVVPLVLEALSFITITTLVGRPRPDVPRLDTSPVGSSFPSGHVAAAVAYSAIVIVVFWHTERRWLRGLAVAVAVLIPLCVSLSRVYSGMHYFTDVVFGVLLGLASVIATFIVLGRAMARQRRSFVAAECAPVPET